MWAELRSAIRTAMHDTPREVSQMSPDVRSQVRWHDRRVADAPWPGDACSLVDVFRAGQRSPLEELEASLAAIDASTLNAFCFLDVDRARAAARQADVSKPFGGVPAGLKELE